MKKQLFFILIWIPFLTFAQIGFNISGNIKDSKGSSLSYVNIVLNKHNKYGVSDVNGKYELQNIPKGEYIITLTTLGYKTVVKKISLNNNLALNFTLEEDTESLKDVVITAKKESTIQKEKPITIGSFEMEDVITTTTIITDQIDKISGVRVRRSGSVGDSSDISINGLKGSSVRMYIDGIPLEFLYPTLDLANIPLTDIQRVDVYKGVIPVDIGTDALGGGINIITGNKDKNNLKASYSIGSFNTHLGDVNLNLVDDKNNFININGGVTYSDNNYTFITDVRTEVLINENDPSAGTTVTDLKDQEVERFHDRYRLQHTSVTIGTSNKKWTDKAQLSLNYLNSLKEIQNGATITKIAIGEAVRSGDNISATLKYNKTLLQDKLKLKTISNLSNENLKFVDTTANVYNWYGNVYVVDENKRGEVSEDPTFIKATGRSYVNRSSLVYHVNDNNDLLLSNIIAHQTRDILSYNFEDSSLGFEKEPIQKITKNILGFQYRGSNLEDKLEYGATVKYYNFNMSANDTRSNASLESKDDFLGWNTSLKYKITPELAIRTSYERGFRIPEIFEFAGVPNTILGNAGIKPEESDNFNFGILYSNVFNESYALSLTTNAFLRKQKNIIYLNISETPSQYVSAEEADTKGIEGEFKLTFLRDFKWVTNISYLDKTFSSVLADANSFLIGTQVPNTPRFFYNTEVNWSKKNIFNKPINISIYGSFNHVDTFNIIPVGITNSPERTPDAYVLDNNRLDAGISLKFLDNRITTAFNIINITDQELFDNYSIPRPGRNFNFKLIYELSNF